MERKSRLNGFTLIEILVVLAIIAVLAAILLTVFIRVRERGRSAVCQSNLKQIALAVHLYTQDNNSHFPIAEGDVFLQPYLGGSVKSGSVFICPTQATDMEDINTYLSNVELADETISFIHHLTLTGKNESVVTKPSITWLDTDGTSDQSHIQFVTPAKGVPCFFTTTWHLGGANYSFVDGHVKWMLPQSACALWNESRTP